METKPLTRAEIRHLVANRITVIFGEAQLVANDSRLHPILKSKVEHLDRVARQLLSELLAMFPEEK